jgi:hydroxyacylglutathione hydrolase
LIRRLVNEVLASNTWICATSLPGEAIVIDPGLPVEPVLDALAANGRRAVAVLLTHGHFDHVGSAAVLQERHGAIVALHAADRRALKAVNFHLMACGFGERASVPSIDVWLTDEEPLSVGGESIAVLHTPGHSPGSCTFLWRDAAFTGDTLLRAGVGLDRFPGEDAEAMRGSLRRLWQTLADDVTVYPGHGREERWSEIRAGNGPLRSLVLDGPEIEAA